MIPLAERFTIEHRESLEDDLEFYMIDWKIRRWYRVVILKSSIIDLESERLLLRLMRNFLVCLSPGVHTVRLNKLWHLQSVSSDFKERPELHPRLKFSYCILESSLYPDVVGTIKFSEPVEMGRLARQVDLVTYKGVPEKRFVFKYDLYRGHPTCLPSMAHVLASRAAWFRHALSRPLGS
jgi:hypothetical protein